MLASRRNDIDRLWDLDGAWFVWLNGQCTRLSLLIAYQRCKRWRWASAESMLGQRLRRWYNTYTTSGQGLESAWEHRPKWTRNRNCAADRGALDTGLDTGQSSAMTGLRFQSERPLVTKRPTNLASIFAHSVSACENTMTQRLCHVIQW